MACGNGQSSDWSRGPLARAHQATCHQLTRVLYQVVTTALCYKDSGPRQSSGLSEYMATHVEWLENSRY